MEARSRVAAAAASVIPFSCIICFDEFNMTDRAPMVLPCGHTYVCLPCTKRLKRCMECREPLFLPPNPNNPNNKIHNSHHQQQSQSPLLVNRASSGGRYSPNAPLTPTTSQPPPPSPAQPTPLPIPKNVVLLAMMEAAQRQAKNDAELSRSMEGIDEDEEEEAFDLDRIITGMATLSGPCGTYGVRERDGLSLLPTDPREHSKLDDMDDIDDEERSPSSEEKKEDEDDCSDSEEGSQVKPQVFSTLEFGQTIQVVSFENGVAKLARGKGFVVASSSQLVKVGGPLEDSCRLEGLLDTVVNRGKDLQRTLEENEQIEAGLRQQISLVNEEEPTHPIIAEAHKHHEPCTTERRIQPEVPTTPVLGVPSNFAQHIMRTPEKSEQRDCGGSVDSIMEFDENGVAVYSPHPGVPRSPNSIDNSDIVSGPPMPRYRETIVGEDGGPVDFGCGSVLIGEGAELFGEQVSDNSGLLRGLDLDGTQDVRRSSTPLSHPGLAPALSSNSSFDGIDFRTGLSGHRALTSSHKHGSSPQPRRHIRMMGEHRGIAHIRRQQKQRSASTDNTPAFLPRFSSNNLSPGSPTLVARISSSASHGSHGGSPSPTF